MNRVRRVQVGLTAVVFSIVSSLTLGATAASAAPANAKARYCFTEMEPSAPGSRTLDFVSRTCSDTAAPGTLMPSTLVRPMVTYTLLVTFFADVDYGGSYDTVGGRFGTCDSSGYGFGDLRNVEGNTGGISSYKLNGACNNSDIWTGLQWTLDKRTFTTQNVRYVGAQHNDKVYSMWVKHR